MIGADHLLTVRRVVAEQHRKNGVPELAERTERGEMDTTPVMAAAIAAVEAVLEELFGG